MDAHACIVFFNRKCQHDCGAVRLIPLTYLIRRKKKVLIAVWKYSPATVSATRTALFFRSLKKHFSKKLIFDLLSKLVDIFPIFIKINCE